MCAELHEVFLVRKKGSFAHLLCVELGADGLKSCRRIGLIPL